MALLIENLERYSQVLLRGPGLTDDEFLEFCREHEDLRVESNAEGELEIMPQPGPETGFTNNDIARDLSIWAEADGRGRALGPTALFRLANGSRRSPDAAWIENSRLVRRPTAERSRPWEMCPDFVIELRSTTDRKATLRDKMREWIENGTRLGWLIDPLDHTVEIYRSTGAGEMLVEPDCVKGEGPVEGFSLSLTRVWEDWPL